MKLFTDLYNSFFNSKDGFSARKLTAFWFTLLATYVHYKHMDNTNAVEFLVVDCCVLLLALSIITAQNIIDLRNGKQQAPQN